MDIELQEIRDFVAQHVLFDELPSALLDRLVNHLTIRYLRRGQVFPPVEIADRQLYLLRSGAVELRDSDGNLIEKLAEDDSFIEQCLHNNKVDISGHVCEDCLVYHIPCSIIQKMRAESVDFDKQFSNSVEQRIKNAVSQGQQRGDTQSAMHYLARDLTDRDPVIVPSNETVVNTARLMTEENVSSVLVVENNKLVGMITDRDLRRRYIAKGLDKDTPVSKIMTTNLITIEDNTMLSEALIFLTRHQIHHLPVMKNARPIGNLSVSDVIRHLSTNSAFIASDIEKANSIEALVHISNRLPELHLQLVLANTSSRQVGQIFSMLTDSLTSRLLELAEQELGTPPVPYVWLAGGSQGRNEQTSHSDQDNALFIDDAMQPGDDEYFSALSQFVSDGLNACGYVYCPGDAMATNPQWRQTVSVWRDYFNNWIEKPEQKALMLASIFFDLRPVYGDVSLFESVHAEMLSNARRNGIFIAYMVANALTHRPPLGFFRNFVLIHDQEHDKTLDVKHRGIVPIVDVGRVYALSEGLNAINTSERIEAACACGAMSQEMSENLIDALEYIGNLRNQHQVELIRYGQKADNYLDPRKLSGLERGHLKDAFSIIKSMQDVLEQRYQAGRMV